MRNLSILALVAVAFGQLFVAGWFAEQIGAFISTLFIVGFCVTLQIAWPMVIRD